MRNLFLVVMDTARADGFTPYGAPANATPAIAGLAGSGTSVPTVIAPSNWTLPSHASMFTGMLPASLGLTSGAKLGPAAGMNSRPLLEARQDRILAGVLRRRGYATSAISTNPWIHEVNGFATGFERFLSIRGGNRRERGEGLKQRLRWTAHAWRAWVDDGAADARSILLQWLDEDDRRPFFWFVNLMECHSPYLPPRPYNDLSGVDRIRAAGDAVRYQTPQGIYRACVGELPVAPAAVDRMRHLYARSITQMDDWIATMLAELDRRGRLDDTMVVVTSDHGENLGENGLMGHVLSMHDRLIRVPMIFSNPVDAPSLASLAQLPSLLAPALGIDDHPWHDDLLPGGYAVSQVAGQALLPEKESLALSWGVPEEAIRRIASPITCATDGRHRLLRDADGERYYDLETDPLEVSPLASGGVPPAILHGLRDAVARVDEMTVEPPAAEGGSAGDEAADLEERLRTLGYI
jgi:arylsulfatase A-like enzyme